MRNGENLYEIIAGNIRRKRKRLSLTQAKLAERADVSIERFIFMMNRCNEREIEFALHMVEQLLKGQDNYLSK